MGLFDRLRGATPASVASNAAAGVVQGTLGAIGQTAIDIRTAITGEAPIDATARAELAAQMAEIEASVLLAQSATNQIEAASPSKFVSWWRPSIGWSCSLGIFVSFVVQPIVSWFLTDALPVLDVGQLIALVVSMLGLGAYRTYEKRAGVVGSH